jgi:hypothetical protein
MSSNNEFHKILLETSVCISLCNFAVVLWNLFQKVFILVVKNLVEKEKIIEEEKPKENIFKT